MTGVTLVSAVRLRPRTERAHRSLHDAAVRSARRIGGLISDDLVPAIPGFGGWFPAGTAEPRRWKQAAVVLAALVPVSLAATVAREAALPGLPTAAAVAVTSAINVAVLTWLAMPVLTSRLESWLTR